MGRRDEQLHRTRSMYTYLEPRSDVSEMYQIIRANLSFSQIDRETQIVVVTSATKGEGKSVTASNLAIASAQAGVKTLLIDGDLRMPVLHRRLGLSNLHGLTTTLLKTEVLENCVQTTALSKLDVLTTGPLPPNPTEVLNSRAMEELLGYLRQSYEFIVIDAPPLLLVSDAQILVSRCDGVILVVGAGVVKRSAALKAKEHLQNAKAHILGVVFNGTKQKSRDYYQYSK